MFCINEWMQRYEVTKDGSPVKTADKPLRKSPLEFVRWKVYGHKQGTGYRKLIERSKGRAMEVLGIFGKLLEIAADDIPEFRGKILNEHHQPATVQDISFMLSVPQKKIEKAIKDLVYLRWVQDVQIVQNSKDSANKEAFGEFAENPDPYITEPKRNENENINLNRKDSPQPPNVAGGNGFEQEPGTGVTSSIDFKRNSHLFRLAFDTKLRKIILPVTEADVTAYHNLIEWILSHNGTTEKVANRVLAVAQSSKKGNNPLGLFFHKLDCELGYRPRAEKERTAYSV